MENFDALVLGTGQGGGPLAGTLSKAGRRVAIFERGAVGGTCINTGCTPTKTMVASAMVAYKARRAAEFGVDVGDVAVDMREVRDRKRRIVEHFRENSEKALAKKENLELVRGDAVFTGPHTVRCGDREFTAPWIFINTGARPAVPKIPGLDSVPWLDNARIEELDAVPRHLIVLGGGYIGCEFAQMFRRFGSDVTIVHSGAQLLDREDDDVAACMESIFADDGIRVLCGEKASAVGADGDGVAVDVGGKRLHGSHLLVAIGRTPNTDTLNLNAAGVKMDEHGFITVNEKLETSAEGIWALGDVKGGPQFTHISYDDFRIVRDNLLHGGARTTNDRMVPYTVYTDPQLGRIGMSEKEARKSGKALATATMPASSIARAEEIGEMRGMLKMIVDRDTDRILGAAMLCSDGGEMAAMIQLAMCGGITCRRIQDFVFAHPTWAESLNNLAGKLQDE